MSSRMADVSELVYDYIECLDSDRLEEWPELFTADGIYEVHSRENIEMGMSLPLVNCSNNEMLQDRVLCLRRTTVYTFHYPRHILSNLRVKPTDAESCSVTANFALFQTDLEGRTALFATGAYDDIVDLSTSPVKFRRKRVVIDTFSINNMISMPI